MKRADANELIIHPFVRGGQNKKEKFQVQMATIKEAMDKDKAAKSAKKVKTVEVMMKENEEAFLKMAEQRDQEDQMAS